MNQICRLGINFITYNTDIDLLKIRLMDLFCIACDPLNLSEIPSNKEISIIIKSKGVKAVEITWNPKYHKTLTAIFLY